MAIKDRIEAIQLQLKTIWMLVFIIFGCVPGPLLVGTENVSNEEELWFGYSRNGIYQLKVDVFLRVRDTNLPSKIVLVAPREETKGLFTLHYTAPWSVKDYKDNEESWPDIIGVVNAGVRIQCNNLVKYKTTAYGNSLYIFAKILNGPFKGIEVEISDLSLVGPEHKSGVFLNAPNLNLLVFVKDK
jgi:hypothetical protein